MRDDRAVLRRGSTRNSGTISGPRRSDEGGEAPCFAHLLDDTSDDVDDRVLAQLVRELADAVVIAGPDGTIAFWNHAATRRNVDRPFVVTTPAEPRYAHEKDRAARKAQDDSDRLRPPDGGREAGR